MQIPALTPIKYQPSRIIEPIFKYLILSLKAFEKVGTNIKETIKRNTANMSTQKYISIFYFVLIDSTFSVNIS